MERRHGTFYLQRKPRVPTVLLGWCGGRLARAELKRLRRMMRNQEIARRV